MIGSQSLNGGQSAKMLEIRSVYIFDRSLFGKKRVGCSHLNIIFLKHHDSYEQTFFQSF